MNKRSITLKETQTKRPSESGVALLTVLALLSIFAVVMVGFTYTIRMEENTIQQYADSVNVQAATEAAIQGVLAQLSNDLDPLKPNYVLGRSQPEYTSVLDDWAVGYAGQIGAHLAYDARSHQLDARPQSVFNRTNLRYWPTPIPMGIDEDPPGDVTGMRGNTRFGSGDNAPGLKDIDDDLDGEVDGSVVNDDDEDYRVDEDGYDKRRDGAYFAPGTGYDIDNDRLGVFDESAKININFAGNNWGSSNGQTYNLGVSTAELDLPVFLFNRVIRYNTANGISSFNAVDAESVAKAIVSFRYGSVSDGGASGNVRPGEDGRDDNNNGNPNIVQIKEYSDAFSVQNFDGEPFAVMGNGIDDDGDGLQNEEDERYIGPTTENSSGSSLRGAFDQNNAEHYRPGDKIDNDGDGYIDEDDEGIDEPSEFNVFKPAGNDRPYTTLEDLKLVERMRLAEPSVKTFPTLYDILSQSTTIYSQSDEISGPLSGGKNEVAKINPNLSSNWLAVDIWDQNTYIDKADFQYSPKIRLEDLLALQVDNDGDWQAEAEINTEDEIDNDGDGLVDEPSDDWDGNYYPSSDFDGFGEADVGAPAFSTGIDYDGDGEQRDKIRTSDDEVIRGMRLLGWEDQVESGGDLTAANFDSRLGELVTYDERITDILPGLVVEGDGKDNDGDLLIDDTGDFNGDGLFSYDPEWHVSEDAWGDLNGDGYPGLGGDPEADEDSREGRIVQEPDNRDDLLRTSLADDDYDGFADFYDPQVLAAMFAPEWDGVDNDNDGEVDEIGERYIACYDDDEDGRMDEDPPEFQIALNLIDSIDTWMPFPVSEDEDVRSLLGKSQDDPVLADPVTFRTLSLYSTRQRSFRMHPRLLAGPNSSAGDRQEFGEQMRLALPNPPQTGMPVKFEGVEAIRINEVMAKPVIRLEAEDVLESIVVNQELPEDNPNRVMITYRRNQFSVESGDQDDGRHPSSRHYDTNWGAAAPSADGDQADPSIPSYTFLPNGFQNTLNTYLPIVNMDTMAPAFIFSVTNLAQPAQSDTTLVGSEPVEEAVWVFENVPEGYYDIVLYLHPYHRYRPEVQYFFNGREVTFRSDFAFGDVQDNTGPFLSPWTNELIRRDTAILPGTENESFRLPYRLTPYPMADKYRLSPSQRVVVGSDGELEVRIVANEPIGGEGSGDLYATSFDRLELISPWTQYVELVNISTEDVDLSGWTIDTPYGHYLIPEDTVIGRMKPSYEDDDGRELTANEGLPGNGVPHEPLLKKDQLSDPGGTISTTDLLLEDNKILLANHENALIEFIKDNYPNIYDVEDRVVELTLAPKEEAMVIRSLSTQNEPMGSGELLNAQQSDLRLRLLDVQEDVLTHNPAEKFVTLSDPSGHYVDSFSYRTTFNNVMVDIPGNNVQMDLAVLPGYRGMESFERSDPTYFDTAISVDNQSGLLSGDRSVPSSIRLDAQDAILLNLDSTKNFERTHVGGYLNPAQGSESDKRHPDLNLPRFVDQSSFPAKDAHWNGWDFIGDYYEYPDDNPEMAQSVAYEELKVYAREAVAPEAPEKVQFYDLLGGFENAANVRTSAQIRYTAFVWRLGLRELIRSGYDPDVDDQLTIRVLGRQAINHAGEFGLVDLPVGEVMVIPAYRVVNPGDNDLDEQYSLEENPYSNVVSALRSNYLKQPVFAKLRNGDTAFTIDLRDKFNDLNQDLKTNNDDEPMIEIMVVLRKSTIDHGAGTTAAITSDMRPDLSGALEALGGALTPDAQGNYWYGGSYIGNLGDDNYFFRGIELFGRGRNSQDDSDEANQRRALLAGTPGRDNTGYVPAYPRRRLDLDGSQRDELDILDNTAYVKNGPLATVGELSRLFTGNRFETINTPLIPQRLEDIASGVNDRTYTTYELNKRAKSSEPEFQIALSQRERLDQWENQYLQLFNMITTSDEGIRAGLINVNTAPREALMALPFCPPAGKGKLESLMDRSNFNAVCADFILAGRQPVGFDMQYGVHSLNDDDFISRLSGVQTMADTISDFKLRSVGREYDSFKNFDDVENERFDRLNLNIENIEGDKPGNLKNDIYLSTELALPDDGPYTDIGTLLMQLTHLSRRDRLSEFMGIRYDRTWDNVKNEAGDLREQLNSSVRGSEPLTAEEMEAVMNRISNLITVRSRAFSIITRGRIFDGDGNITAQRKLEAVYQR